MLNHAKNFTFLFTDIERSSELWETHPQAMGRALAQHDMLLRAAIFEKNDGHIFKTIGDAFCVAFDKYPRCRQRGHRGPARSRWPRHGRRPAHCASGWPCTTERRNNATTIISDRR